MLICLAWEGTRQAGKERWPTVFSQKSPHPSEWGAGERLDEFRSYLILEVLLGNLHRVVLNAVAAPLVCRLLGHQLFEDEEQQLVVVPTEGQISSKGLSKRQKRKERNRISDEPNCGGKRAV